MGNSTRFRPHRSIRLELASLIDMAFLLLIFFLLVTLTPKGPTQLELEGTRIPIAIHCKTDGSLLLNNIPLSRQKLLTKLHTSKRHAITISADNLLANEAVVSLINTLVHRGFHYVKLESDK